MTQKLEYRPFHSFAVMSAQILYLIPECPVAVIA